MHCTPSYTSSRDIADNYCVSHNAPVEHNPAVAIIFSPASAEQGLLIKDDPLLFK